MKPLRRCARHRHIHLQRTDSRRSGCPPLCVSSDREIIYTLEKFPLDSSILYIYTRMTRATDDHFSPFARFFFLYTCERALDVLSLVKDAVHARRNRNSPRWIDRSSIEERERENTAIACRDSVGYVVESHYARLKELFSVFRARLAASRLSPRSLANDVCRYALL